jgi:1-acyl-sn-glycerol-3-phosphate acyltransferase
VVASRQQLPPAYKFIVLWLRPLLRALTHRDWRGMEQLPQEGGFIAAPNHMSYFDPFVIALFLFDNGRPPFFLGKEAVFRIPVLGKLIGWSGQIPVYRGTGQAGDAYRAAVAAVNDGKAVVVFPEGTLTREPNGWPMRGKTGAARLALQTGQPVIPIAQWGAQEVLATYSTRPRFFPRKTVHVLAGPPVDLDDLRGRPMDAGLLAEATERIMAAITTLLEHLRAEPAPAQRFDPRAAGVAEIGKPTKKG